MNDILLKAVKLYPNVIEYLSLSQRLEARKATIPLSRDDLERRLARQILIVDRAYLAILENNNGILPFNYWINYENDLRQAIASPLRAQIEQSFTNYSDYTNFIDKAGAIGDIDTAMTRAINDVAHGVAENSRLQYEALVRQGISQEQIAERMALRFSSGHAEQIAVTELTRANGHFSEALSSRLAEQEVATQIRWQTSEDEKVCPICSPADHKLKDEPINTAKGGWNGQTWGERYGSNPPHPHCRCDRIVEIITRKPLV